MRALWAKHLLLTTAVFALVAGLLCAPCGRVLADSAYLVPLEARHASAIACMKRLPDGAQVCVNQKTVVGISNGSLFIEEADRSAGIKIDIAEHYPPVELELGNLLSFAGEMGTVDGERVVYARSEFDADLTASARIGSLGMSSPAIMGWPIDYEDIEGPRITGLVPIGLLVRVWGEIIARELSDDEGAWYIYLDDGWHMKDGTYPGYTGIRVYSDKIPPGGEDFQVGIGVCTTKTYDPTPLGPDGDEFVIPVVRTTNYEDLYYPQTPPAQRTYGVVSGRVRLVGQSEPGVDARVYCGRDSTTLEGVTDTWASYTLSHVCTDGEKITASAPGYMSRTVDANGGDTDVDFELVGSEKHVEIGCDKQSIRTCSEETAVLTAMVRDCEGKGLPGEQVKLVTTMGSFVDAQGPEIIVTTDSTGFAQALFTAAPGGAGVACITAEPYPEMQCSAQIELTLTGPEIRVTADCAHLAHPGSSTISACLTDGGEPIVGGLVEFQTDHGVFQETGTDTYVTNTNAEGNAEATLVVSTPGVARVLASHTNACNHGTVGWTTVAYKAPPWYNDGAQYSNPLVAELNGDPSGKEVVVVTSSGNLVALSADADVLWHKSMHPPGSNTPSCSPIDGERSGLPCVFICAENQQKVYAFAHDGTPLAGWPTGTNYRFIKVAPAIADVNLDGSREIVAGDECCYVFSWNPTGDWQGTGTSNSSFLWRNLTGTPSTAIYGSTCALGDVNGDTDGILDVMVGTNHAPEVYGFPGDAWGDFISDPFYLDGWPKGSDGRAGSSPAIGDIDGDGRNDVAIGSDSGHIYIWLSSADTWTGYPTGGPVKSSPALCDLDGDDKLDVIVGAGSGRVFAFNWLGQSISGWSGGIRLNDTGDYPVESSPVVGDVTGDGNVEVVVGCSDGNIYALYADGVNHEDGETLVGPIAWVRCCVPPGDDSASVLTAPAIGDLDNDGFVDVVAASDKGIYVFPLDVPYVQDPDLYPWPTFHHDNQRTGCATPPPAPVNASIQGIVTKDGEPVCQAEVYVYFNDGSPVYVPYSDPLVERGYVYTVGEDGVTEAGKGVYCISQLQSNATYKIKVQAPGEPDKWVNDIVVTTGLVRVDVELSP